MFELDAEAARRVACLLACAGIAVSSLEWLLPARKLRPDGLLAPRWSPGEPSTTLRRLWRPHGLRLVLVLRLAFALWFLAGGQGFAVLAAGLLCLPLRVRDPVGVFAGMDGAEQLLTATLLALGASFASGSTLAATAALVFVAGQVLLEYSAAGWTKLRAASGWASGRHLREALTSSNYGHPALARITGMHPALAGAVALPVIALEIAVPFALVLPPPGAELLLLAVLAFHLGVAVTMGLSTFVWAYAATFPAILYCRDLLLGL